MRCYACGRPLTRAAYTHALGWVLGPICFGRPEKLPPEIGAELKFQRAMGNLPEPSAKKRKPRTQKKRVKKIKQVARNDDQFDLFSG